MSCSHNAGQRIRRQQTRQLKPNQIDATQTLSWQCVTLKEERIIEESPHAYKKIDPVIEAQEEAGLINSVARFRPWITFKA